MQELINRKIFLEQFFLLLTIYDDDGDSRG